MWLCASVIPAFCTPGCARRRCGTTPTARRRCSTCCWGTTCTSTCTTRPRSSCPSPCSPSSPTTTSGRATSTTQVGHTPAGGWRGGRGGAAEGSPVCHVTPAGRIKAIQLEYSEARRTLTNALRKAPQHTAVGFKQTVRTHTLTHQQTLKQSEPPEIGLVDKNFI